MARRVIRPEEKRLWQKVARTIRPMRKAAPEKIEKSDPPQITEDFQSLLSEKGQRVERVTFKKSTARATQIQRQILDETPEPVPQSPIFNRETERKVRRGQVFVDASLDMHGFNQLTARSALLNFLTHHRAQGARAVLVITGKGKMGGGIIKSRLFDWLHEPEIRVHVSSYAQAHQRHGGGGAFYLFLRRPGVDK